MELVKGCFPSVNITYYMTRPNKIKAVMQIPLARENRILLLNKAR
jgi:hypothetical protein